MRTHENVSTHSPLSQLCANVLLNISETVVLVVFFVTNCRSKRKRQVTKWRLIFRLELVFFGAGEGEGQVAICCILRFSMQWKQNIAAILLFMVSVRPSYINISRVRYEFGYCTAIRVMWPGLPPRVRLLPRNLPSPPGPVDCDW